jgi:hypothetical protein
MTIEHPAWWDPHSDQPFKLSRQQKPRITAANLIELLRTGLSTAVLLPAIAWCYATQKRRLEPPAIKEFAGLGISPEHGNHNAIVELVAELGVERLLIRVPTWQVEQLDPYLRFAELFQHHRILINILQDRQHVTEPERWLNATSRIIDSFSALTNEFQLGNAINRSKWGCQNTQDYLNLLDCNAELKRQYPQIQVAGSSVIDFEPLSTLRTLFNFHQYQLDACSALLYVNRRGSPYAKQFGCFDLEKKIRILAALVSLSNRCDRKLWITEVNWPLLNTKPYTPNSGHPRSTVDEDTQAQYLTEYFEIARQTGLVDRVYWWQLINPGYGLVDHRGDDLRKMPSFYAFKRMLEPTQS